MRSYLLRKREKSPHNSPEPSDIDSLYKSESSSWSLRRTAQCFHSVLLTDFGRNPTPKPMRCKYAENSYRT